MRPTSILGSIAAAALALLGLLWWLLDLGNGGGLSAASVRPHPGEVSSAPESTASATVADEDAPASVAAAGQRAEVDRPAASAATTCRIRVVLAASGAPVPDARVWIQRDDVDWKSSAWNKAMRRFNDVEPVLQSGLGREYALDANGEVRVARPARKLSLAAARGELHGEAMLGPDDASCTVELEAYHSLACEVVDRSGRPVEGAEVSLHWGDFDPLEHDWTWIAGADGRVWIPKLEQHLWPGGYQGPLRLALAAGVTGEPEIVLFSTESIPTDPVRFVAGDFGRVVVQLADPQGTELALEGYAHVEINWDSIFDRSLAMRGGASLHQPLDSGRAVFECVGLGFLLEISVGARGHDHFRREALGPTTPGQEVRVLMPIGDRQASARGSVRGIQASFGDANVRGARLEARGPVGCGSFQDWLQQDGPFEDPIWRSSELEKLHGTWTLELSNDGGPTLRADAVPVIDEQGAVLDFGEIVFDPQPVLARLLVTDAAGAAVKGAQIEVSSGASAKRLLCDEKGRFLLAGETTELPMGVRSTHASWLPSDWVQIQAPNSDITLVLGRAATLTGQLLLPRAGNLDDFEVDLRIVPRGISPMRPSFASGLVEGGRFRFEACEPGLGSLSILHAERLVLEREGIELRSGETTVLAPIDLAGVLHPFELSFALASGEPWSSGHLELLDPDGELSLWRSIGPSARAAFLAPRASVDLWVAGTGARPVLFQNVLDGDRLALPGAPSVVLRVPREIHLPAPPLVLMVHGDRILPETVELETYDDLDSADAIVGDDGTAHLRMPWPGDYELRWFVRHSGTGVDFAIQQSEPQTVHVPELPPATILEAELTRAEVAAAVLAAGG